MKKIPTLFVRDPQDMRHVTSAIPPDCEWVIWGEGVPTRKYDGTCVMIDERGKWWTRREVKPDKTAPDGFIAVELDETTGKTVGWEPAEQSAWIKYLLEAVNNEPPFVNWDPGTYELIGPKVNGNPESADGHTLVRHDFAEQFDDVPRDFDGLRSWLLARPQFEGIVWHHPDGRMAKLKRRDFE